MFDLQRHFKILPCSQRFCLKEEIKKIALYILVELAIDNFLSRLKYFQNVCEQKESKYRKELKRLVKVGNHRLK